MKPIVLIHGYSSEGKSNSAADIYGTLPADLRREFGANQVLDVNLSRWISLSDGVALDDVSFAMERALNSPKFRHLLRGGFNVVIHSTGALVVRNWLRLFPRKPSPVACLVHLAGANFGSGLAHVGRGTLVRWSRQIFQGVDPGARVLDELEFGASKTLDLHLHFLQPGHRLAEDYGVREFCLIGSQTLNGLRFVPIRYVKEDSADNTVRTSACNLNFNHVTVKPTAAARQLSAARVDHHVASRLAGEPISRECYDFDLSALADERPAIPFAVLYETAHFGAELGIVHGSKTRRKVLPLLVDALSAPDTGTSQAELAARWHKVTARTLQRAGRLKGRLTDWNRRAQYEGHSQLIFRLRDQYGADVAEHDITFKSGGGRGRERLEWMIEDKHTNRLNPGTTTFYLRTQQFVEKVPTSRLDRVAPLDLEITGCETQSRDIRYLPVRVRLSAANLRRMLQPFRTTLVDVELMRLPSGNVFRVTKG